jgi:DNA-binding NarL/FixJ family response regulator
MTTLLVEDDDDKREQLASFLKQHFQTEIFEAQSVQSAVRAIIQFTFKLVILDMSMTTFDPTLSDKSGGRPQSFGGREILLQMKRRGLQTKAIIVTQYDVFGQENEIKTIKELDKELQEMFPKLFMGIIYYSSQISSWQEKLLKLIKQNKLLS